MNEKAWLNANEARDLLGFVCGNRWARSLTRLFSPRREQAGQRRLRLYLCVCVRHRWQWLGERSRAAVETAERFADGLATLADLDAARWAAEAESVAETGDESWWTRLKNELGRSEYDVDHWSLAAASAAARRIQQEDACRFFWTEEEGWKTQAGLLRCIFGNPFRPVGVDPAGLAWNDGLVVRLAEAAYEERLLPSGLLDPVRLAVLADALEEAGAGDQHLLAHLRGPGPHARGCFALAAARG